MIYYLATRKHTYTIWPWLRCYPEQWKGRMKALPYDELSGSFQKGCFIFSDIERLSKSEEKRVLAQFDKIKALGLRTLNHPVLSQKRVGLQRKIENDFKVYRSSERLDFAKIKFPVFLRIENDHLANLTDLLKSEAALRAALKEHKDALIVEFLDTADEEGIYRKYSMTRIGEQLIPRHLLFSRNWMLKHPDLITSDFLREEEEFINNPTHMKEIMQIFEKGHIEYGRIDYSFYKGKLQVWEINSNPLMATYETSHPDRQFIHTQVGNAINRAFEKLDLPSVNGDIINLGWRPRLRFWKSRFIM